MLQFTRKEYEILCLLLPDPQTSDHHEAVVYLEDIRGDTCYYIESGEGPLYEAPTPLFFKRVCTCSTNGLKVFEWVPEFEMGVVPDSVTDC